MLQLERIRWGRLALAWLVFALFTMGLVYGQTLASGAAVQWRPVVLGPLLNSALWMLLTPVVFWLAARFDITAGRHRWLPYGLAHVVLGLALALLHRILYIGLLYVVGVPGPGVSWGSILSAFNVWVIMYWMILFIAYALEFYDKYQRRSLEAARLETQLVQAQLRALKMQLQPHFLFNALNAIAALTGDDARAGQRMMGKLGQFLRLVLDRTEAQQVTLEQELQFAALYLDIEQVRFSDRLQLYTDIDPAALRALVPSLLLQPLLENAVRHGLGTAAAGGTIRIGAERRGPRLLLSVHDDGAGAPPAAPSSPGGIGLRNGAERLHALYGDQASLTVQSGPGFTVRIELPFRT